MTNLTDGDACLMIRTTLTAVKDILAKLALIGSMVLCFAIILAWISLWESTWRIAAEPTKASIYRPTYRAPLDGNTPARWIIGGDGGRRGRRLI